jgi:hypothetical protein
MHYHALPTLYSFIYYRTNYTHVCWAFGDQEYPSSNCLDANQGQSLKPCSIAITYHMQPCSLASMVGIAHALIPVKQVALSSTLHKMNLTKGK